MTTSDLNFFFSAAQIGDIFILKKCLDDGIDIHAFDDLALRLATQNYHAKAVLFLIARGANIQAVYDEELRHASLEGKTRTVEILLKDYSCSQEAKMFAMYNAIFGRHEDIVELLLQNGFSPKANNGAILNVVNHCNNEKIKKLFDDYL